MISRILLIGVTLALVGCQKDESAPRAEDRAMATTTQPTAFTGTLRGGMMAIGGETTGWTLVGDGQTGGIQVDVSRLQGQAQKLDGKRVTITGRMGEKNYVESGKTPVLIAEKIEAAAEPAAR
jgi:hypothetical protein